MKLRIVIALWVVSAAALASDWDRFHGPHGSGRIAGPPVPMEWSGEQNLMWKTALPGRGVSSPVVRGDRVYLTCYTGYGLDPEEPGDPEKLVRHLLAFDRKTGKELWRSSVPGTDEEDPYQGFLTQHGYASSTPAVDDERVYALLGKSGLFAFDLNGKKLWQAEIGRQSDPARWGDGSSPIVVGDVVVVDAGILGHQMVGIDKRSGKQLWSVKDPSFTNSWASPATLELDGKVQVLVHVPRKVISLDPQTGKVNWSAETPLTDAASSSIVTRNGVAFLMGSRAGHGLAVDCRGSGDVSESHTVWKARIRSGISTPVVIDKTMYWLAGGIFCAADLETGEYVYRERLPRLGGPAGGFPNAEYSSPIAIGDKIVQFTRNGESYVIDAADEFKLVSHNPPFRDDESAFSASPAASDGQLFVRSERFLYCIAAKGKQTE